MTVFDGIKIPKVIFETQSKFNGNVQVFQVGNVRKIKVEQFDQSVNHESESCKRLVWGRVIDVLKEETPSLAKMLVLGLGGGTIPHLLAKNFPGINITSVEIDPVMVEIAKNYFDLDQIPNHRVIIADALRVVVEPEEFQLAPSSFQALLVDIFIGEKYPDLGSSGNFISAVKRMVSSGGLVIFNRIYISSHQDEVNTFVEYLSNYFKNVKCLIVAGHTNSDNILIYGRV